MSPLQITPAQFQVLLAEYGLSSAPQLTVQHIMGYCQNHRDDVSPDQMVILGAIEKYLDAIFDSPSGRLSPEAFAARLHDPVVFLRVLSPDPEPKEAEGDPQQPQVVWGMVQGLRVAGVLQGALEWFKDAGAITLGVAYLILLGGAFLVASPLILPVMAYKDRAEKKIFFAEQPDALRLIIMQFSRIPRIWSFEIRSVASLVSLVTDQGFFAHVKELMNAYLGVYEGVIEEYSGEKDSLTPRDLENRFAAFGIFGKAGEHRKKIYRALKYHMSEALMSFVTTLVMSWIENRKYSNFMEDMGKYVNKNKLAEAVKQHTELCRMLDEFIDELRQDHAQLTSLWDRIDSPQALLYWIMARYLDDPIQEKPWSEYVVTPSILLQDKDYKRIKHLATLWDDVFSRVHLRKVSDFYFLSADEDKYKALCLLFPQVGETAGNYNARLGRLEKDLQGMGRWMPRWTRDRQREAGTTFGLTRAMRTVWWKLFAKDEFGPGANSRPWELVVVTMTAASLAKEKGNMVLGGSELQRLTQDGDYPISHMKLPLIITNLHQPPAPEKYVLYIYNFQKNAPDTRDIFRKAKTDNYAAYVCVLPPYPLEVAGQRQQAFGYTGHLQHPHEQSLMKASFRVHVALDYGLDPRQVDNIEIVTMPRSAGPGPSLGQGDRRSGGASGSRAHSGPATGNGLRVVRDSDNDGGEIEDFVSVIEDWHVVQGGVSALNLAEVSPVTAPPEPDEVRSSSIGGSDVDASTDGAADDHLVDGATIYRSPTATLPAAQSGATHMQRSLLLKVL